MHGRALKYNRQMMMQTLFKKGQQPSLNTPYRHLALDTDDKGAWRVRLIAGEKAGREHANVLQTMSVKSFDDGRKIYDEMFRTLQAEDWNPYSPQWTSVLKVG